MRLYEKSQEKVKGHPRHFYKYTLVPHLYGTLALELGLVVDI